MENVEKEELLLNNTIRFECAVFSIWSVASVNTTFVSQPLQMIWIDYKDFIKNWDVKF